MEETILLEVNKKEFEKLERILESQEDGLYREYLDLVFKNGKLILQCDFGTYNTEYNDPNYESIGNIVFKPDPQI